MWRGLQSVERASGGHEKRSERWAGARPLNESEGASERAQNLEESAAICVRVVGDMRPGPGFPGVEWRSASGNNTFSKQCRMLRDARASAKHALGKQKWVRGRHEGLAAIPMSPDVS